MLLYNLITMDYNTTSTGAEYVKLEERENYQH